MTDRVLIADDDRDARVLWSAVAEAEGLQVTEAEDGREAIGILDRDAGYRLIILDVMMPYVEGYEVLKQIRSVERLKEIPVIISTADRTTRGLARVPALDRGFRHLPAGQSLQPAQKAYTARTAAADADRIVADRDSRSAPVQTGTTVV